MQARAGAAGESNPSGRPLARHWRDTVLLVAAFGLCEVLALAPRGDWLGVRFWWLALVLALTVGTCLALPSWLAGRLTAGLKGAPAATEDLARQVVLVVLSVTVALAYLWEPIVGRIRSAVASGLTGALLLAAGPVGYLGVRWLGRRLGAEPRQLVPPLFASLTAPLYWLAATRTLAADPGTPPHRTALALLALTYVGALWLAWAAQLRRPSTAGARPAWQLQVTLAAAALVLLRLTTVHPSAYQSQPTSSPRQSAAGRPPVVLIVLDTFRADALERSESGLTPALAELASRSDTSFDAIANASWTLPGHASLFTGLALSEHRTDVTGEPGFSPRLPTEVTTAAEIFRAAGYRTTAVVANPVVTHSSGLLRGFERYVVPDHTWVRDLLGVRLAYQLSLGTRPQVVMQTLMDLFGINYNPGAREIVDLALAAIDESDGTPFLFLNLMDVHRPYPPAPGTSLGTRLRFLAGQAGVWSGLLDERDWERRFSTVLRGGYRHRVRELDRQLARLFAGLRQRELFSSAVLAVTSDHGESFHDNPELPTPYGHHGAYEAVVRIPVLVKHPHQPAERDLPEPFQQSHLLAHLLAAAGLEPPAPTATGGPGAPTLSEWNPRPRSPGVEFVRHYPVPRTALYERQLKYVRDGTGREQLFDLDTSPWEEIDVSGEQPETVRRLAAVLDRWLAGRRREEPEGLSPELERELEALGYIQ